MRIFDNLPHIDFMKYKGLALSISWGLIVICVLLVRPWSTQHSRVKLGMQFTGGLDMMVRFSGEMPQETLRAALAQNGFPDASVINYQRTDGLKDYSIKVKAKKGQSEKDATSAQEQPVRKLLKTLDPQAATDPRPALNSDSVTELVDAWVKANPLAIQGDEETLRAAYQPQVAKIVQARDKDHNGILTSYGQLPQDLPQALRDDVQKSYRLGSFSVVNSESFSPAISGEWTWKTIRAVLIAFIGILVYVMFRFTASFAVGGIFALFHDVLMAVGIFTLCGFEYSVSVVASFLILIGYSMADTIVVFDRIRENSHKPEYRRATITQLVNDSINQTLSRTILTSCSVLFVSLCLFLWGGPALRDLSFPLVIGVITGTYSSIYMASPVVVYWDKWFGGKDKLKQKHA